ncbi:MAG TPA: enoyl-CoA hydratase/isomerase family protein [Actinomycetota bacterium]|nr:enoyl-CoA hydratase/isomerase family protein [Actinomycetota bacterium]
MTLFSVEWREGIAIAHLDRPPVNALDRDLLQAIGDGFADLLSEDAAAVVLTGEGSCFSAGADLFAVLEGSTEYIEGTVSALSAAFGSLFEFPRPVVAAVNGHAIAGGAVLTCGCDYRIMAAGSGKIGISELRVGVPFPTYAIEIMRFAVGPRHIQELTYLAKSYDPEVAITKGLIDEIVEPDALMERAFQVAHRLAQIPTASFEAMKKILRAPTLDRIARYGPEHDARARAGWASPEVRSSIEDFLDRTVGREKSGERG